MMAGVDTSEIPPVPPGVKIVTLDNGLQIIVREDHSAPVVSAQVWCKTGSIHEGRWLGSGISHVLEHMLFKGTTTRGAGRIDQEVQEAGGYMNAYTSFDRTVYWINVPNTGAKVAVDILCDIVQNATLPHDELAKELDVIRREMDMNQDDPNRRASRRLFETAYTRSPYRFTVIGYPDIFNQLEPADITTYYRERYAPNNMFLVVAGDVRANEIIAQVREAFLKSKARPLPSIVLPQEPKQAAAREVIEEAPVELGHFHLSWHIPDLRHPDMPAIDVLAALLGSGRSSRLYRNVRETKALAVSVDAWTYSPGDPGLFGMSAVVEPEKFDEARRAMLDEIDRIQDELIPADELSKVVKQFIAATLATRKSMQGQAQDLGSNWISADDLNFSERYLAAVKRITPADLQRVAREYLTHANRTLYALLPEGASPKPAEVLESAAKSAVQKFELANGLRLLVKEDHRLPFVEIRALFTGGVLVETPENNGVTQLTAKLLLQGTTRRTAEQIATEIESLGGSIDSYGANNSFGLSAEVLSGDFEFGLTLVADVLFNPLFPEDAFEREREFQLASVRSLKDKLLQSAGRAMRRGLFGDTGYGLDALGTEESLPQIGREQIAALHCKLVVPNNCVLAIFGDIHPGEARSIVERLFGQWQPGAEAPSLHEISARQTRFPTAPKHTVETRDKKQAVLVIGFPGVALDSPERFALELLQEACSDLGSRLFLRIREHLGLAYYVGAQHFMGLLPGYFAFYCGTAPEKAELVETQLLKEAELLRSEGLTEEELKRAKAKLIGQKKIARQDLGSEATAAALDELYGLGYDFGEKEDAKIEAVTLDEVIAAANKFLRPDTFVVATIKPG